MAASRGNSGGPIGYLAELFGASEPALKLLFTILLGYPLALVHRYLLFGKSATLQHIFFIICGLSLGYYNYGYDILHSVACVFIVYIILAFIGGTFASVVICFTFVMGYLIFGYYLTGTDDYDIKWSMPQCVLTLRLIGLAYDVYDGQKPPEKLSNDQKKTALASSPTLLEMAGHTYFFGGFMVGPQFPMKRYITFIDGKSLAKDSEGLPSCIGAGVRRLGFGMLILSIYQIGSIFIPEKFMLSETYMLYPFWKKFVVIGIWGKIALYKYIACWLISEGSCILTGMTYNGKDKNGNETWDGCANVKLYDFSITTTFEGIIRSFNINTNLWVGQYVFKRLKFMGNRYISQAAALSFLAIWHGLHSGYYVCFLNEFIVMYLEKDHFKFVQAGHFVFGFPIGRMFAIQPKSLFGVLINHKVESILNSRLPKVKEFLMGSALRLPILIIMKLYVDMLMGYCLIPFVLLSFDRYMEVYGSVYYLGHIVYLGWPLFSPIVKLFVAKAKDDKVKAQ